MNQEIPSRFIMNPERINFILHRRRGSGACKKIYSNQDSSYTFPDRPPMFKGGKKVLKNFVDQHIHYPTDAWQHDITGMISVSMKIDTMGHLSSYHLINRVYPSLDAEASRICRIIPDTWIPALVRGKKWSRSIF